jgi:hypothetical protein
MVQDDHVNVRRIVGTFDLYLRVSAVIHPLDALAVVELIEQPFPSVDIAGREWTVELAVCESASHRDLCAQVVMEGEDARRHSAEDAHNNAVLFVG